MSRSRAVVARAGAAICALGLLLVAFVAYQLWGTALYESHAQARLRREISGELGRGPGRTGAGGVGRRTGSTRPAATPRPPQPASSPAPAEPDPPVGSPVGVLTIPAIGLDDVIVEGVGAPQLEQGPGHYPGTPLPGERGNVGIAGHRTTYARPFYDLNRLHDGDVVDVQTLQGYFRYTVTGSQVVLPTDVEVLASRSNADTLTLTTCNPRYSAATRLVVTAVFTSGTGRKSGSHGSASTPVPSGDRSPPPAAARAAPAAVRTAEGGGRGGGGGTLDDGTGNYLPAVLWGLATAAVAVATRVGWRRSSRRFRWAVVAIGVPLVAGALLLCFEHLSLALPASY